MEEQHNYDKKNSKDGQNTSTGTLHSSSHLVIITKLRFKHSYYGHNMKILRIRGKQEKNKVKKLKDGGFGLLITQPINIGATALHYHKCWSTYALVISSLSNSDILLYVIFSIQLLLLIYQLDCSKIYHLLTLTSFHCPCVRVSFPNSASQIVHFIVHNYNHCQAYILNSFL